MPLSSTSLSEESGNKKRQVDYNSTQVSCEYSWLPLTVCPGACGVNQALEHQQELAMGSFQTCFHTLLTRDTLCLKPSQILYKTPRAHSESSWWVQTQLVLLCAFLGMQTRWGIP